MRVCIFALDLEFCSVYVRCNSHVTVVKSGDLATMALLFWDGWQGSAKKSNSNAGGKKFRIFYWTDQRFGLTRKRAPIFKFQLVRSLLLRPRYSCLIWQIEHIVFQLSGSLVSLISPKPWKQFCSPHGENNALLRQESNVLYTAVYFHLSLSLSLSHTHTHTRTLAFSLSSELTYAYMVHYCNFYEDLFN
jgi:hypothetical protein